ncbi:MAG: LysE family translocator [Rhodospirillales bacterium]|nr:LysE family translocator [Rhodospirillales bacterium]
MSLDLCIAFVLVAASVIALPGPTVMLIAGFALSSGERPALLAIAGVALGDITAISLSFAGMGVVLATSATLFAILKWAGVAYLLWLGIGLWRRPAMAPNPLAATPRLPVAQMIGKAYAVTALNPKGLLFFTAFMPQFINPATAALPQVITLAAIYVSLAIVILAVYVRVSGRLRRALAKPGRVRLGNRVAGTLLIVAGAITANLSRT